MDKKTFQFTLKCLKWTKSMFELRLEFDTILLAIHIWNLEMLINDKV